MVFFLNFEELQAKAPHGKVRLTIEYDGTGFCGWQRQADGIPSIQGAIEEALRKTFGKKIDLVGAGRTDSGVHAENQVAHFIAPKNVKGFNFVHLFQALLPPAISIKGAQWVPPHFHAQKSAVSKIYVYRIWNQPVPSALRASKSLWIRKPLDLEKLNQAAKDLLGTHDFNCFRSEGSAVKNTIRTVEAAHFSKNGDYVEFRIQGSGFLKQMVRNIVGTLLQIELNNRPVNSLPALIASRDRKLAGPTVSPQGLYLERVLYSTDLDRLAQPL